MRSLTNFDDGTKKCALCLETKPVAAFYKRRHDSKFYSSDCIDCRRQATPERGRRESAKQKLRRLSDPEWQRKQGEYHREWDRKRRRENPAANMLRSARTRAKQLGLGFDLTIEDVVVPTVCPVLGIPIAVSTGQPGPGSPTLDRIDNSKGYVRGNVAVISYRANVLKKDATLSELEALVEYVRSHRRVKLRLVKP